MIKGNVSDTYTILFADGEQFSLMASNESMAKLLAVTIKKTSSIVNVARNEDQP